MIQIKNAAKTWIKGNNSSMFSHDLALVIMPL